MFAELLKIEVNATSTEKTMLVITAVFCCSWEKSERGFWHFLGVGKVLFAPTICELLKTGATANAIFTHVTHKMPHTDKTP